MSNSNTSESAERSTVTGSSGASVEDQSTSVETESTEMAAPESLEESEEEEESLSLDIVFGILSNRRRQLVLEYLRDNDGEATTGELAEHIAAIENDTTIQQLNAQQRKRVYIGLYQSHLPKMDDVDVIDFNQSRGRVSPGKHIEPLYEYLDVANGDKETGSDEGENIPDDHADDPGGIGAIGPTSTDEDAPLPLNRLHAAGYCVFGTAFFIAQLSGAHMVASGTVVAFLVLVLLVSYESL